MRIVVIYGRFSSGGPNSFDVKRLYKTKGLTGSESFFFNTVRGLAELGHQVQAFCDTSEELEAADTLAGAGVFRLESSARMMDKVDAVLAWNEPDLLRMFPGGPLRICVQQLNDFNYCYAGFDEHVDVYAFPSEMHRAFMGETYKIPPTRSVVLPNSLNPEFYEGAEERRPLSVAYCSSPDRGLHWLLEYWPAIRQRVPDAQLRIYYKVEPWLNSVRQLWYDHGLKEWYEIGFRARYVEECLRRLGRAGEHGVHLIGPISNQEMARELMRTEVFAYPCDTVRWTEGFSVAVLDACAAGCVPLISDIDAIGAVHGHAAQVLPGRPQSQDDAWIDAIVAGLTDEEFRQETRARLAPHVAAHSRQNAAERWTEIIEDRLARRAVDVFVEAVAATELGTGL